MKIFVSWSGNHSRAFASALDTWLRCVFPDADLWMSDRDIKAGERWAAQLDDELDTTDFGILCLTLNNLSAAWLLYEAGALSKAVRSSRVVPYCLGIEPDELTGPLARFQSVRADEDGTLRLVQSINSSLERPRTDEVLRRTFETWWPDLERQLVSLPSMPRQGPDVVRVERILCAYTKDFEDLGVEADHAILEESFPGAVILRGPLSSRELRQTLASQRFDIVHLLAYVEPKRGDLRFEDDQRLSPEGLAEFFELAKVRLAFLATCDSLVLAAKLARRTSIIAASDLVKVASMTEWEQTFYPLLARGNALSRAYDVAQAATDVPMVLLMRTDTVFMPAKGSDGPR